MLALFIVCFSCYHDLRFSAQQLHTLTLPARGRAHTDDSPVDCIFNHFTPVSPKRSKFKKQCWETLPQICVRFVKQHGS